MEVWEPRNRKLLEQLMFVARSHKQLPDGFGGLLKKAQSPSTDLDFSRRSTGEENTSSENRVQFDGRKRR